jgi:UDP-N-acetylmuramoylalanine--D-glutamate ligase
MNLRGRKVTVVGMGKTAQAAVKLLLREGAEPFVTDSGAPETRQAQVEFLQKLGVPYECGGHSVEAFSGAAYVLPSPGVAPALSCIQDALQRGASLLCELELASWFNMAPVLAVTGTNGKTTTTELLRALIAACGHRVALAGNNQTPFSSVVLGESKPEYVVLEVSSYQSELIDSFRPWIAAVLNVTPDHLARHGSMERYAAAKARLFANQGPKDVCVLNADDAVVAGMADRVRSEVHRFSLVGRLQDGLWTSEGAIYEGDRRVAEVGDTILPGRHNLANVLAALAMMRAGGFDWSRTLDGLRTFRGVEHRIEFVGACDGVSYYNDSKSTNLDSLRVALESFDTPLILIAGGQGKGGDYRDLRDLVRRHVKQLVLLGEDAPSIDSAYGDLVPVSRVAGMEDAVQRAAALSKPGDVVLLSPACASFDMFDNFEHRGRVFKQCVHKLNEDLVR